MLYPRLVRQGVLAKADALEIIDLTLLALEQHQATAGAYVTFAASFCRNLQQAIEQTQPHPGSPPAPR
jgi:hypothetical protein